MASTLQEITTFNLTGIQSNMVIVSGRYTIDGGTTVTTINPKVIADALYLENSQSNTAGDLYAIFDIKDASFSNLTAANGFSYAKTYDAVNKCYQVTVTGTANNSFTFTLTCTASV